VKLFKDNYVNVLMPLFALYFGFKSRKVLRFLLHKNPFCRGICVPTCTYEINLFHKIFH
jgi:hypothetical protein